MSPAQPEIHRSGRTPLDPDHVETQVEVERHAPHDEPGGGPIPEGNQPGHHPEHDQDKPDLDEFAAKFGTAPPDERASTDDAPAPEDDTADDDTDADAGSASSDQSADRDEGSSGDDDRSTAETVTSMVSSGLSAGASVAGSALRGLKGLAERVADKKREGASKAEAEAEADADRIARLESRVADLERQLRDR